MRECENWVNHSYIHASNPSSLRQLHPSFESPGRKGGVEGVEIYFDGVKINVYRKCCAIGVTAVPVNIDGGGLFARFGIIDLHPVAVKDLKCHRLHEPRALGRGFVKSFEQIVYAVIIWRENIW